MITNFSIFSVRSKFGTENLSSLIQEDFLKVKKIAAKIWLFLRIRAFNKDIKSKRKFCRQPPKIKILSIIELVSNILTMVLESMFIDLLVCIVNMGTLKVRSGQIEEMLVHRSLSLNISCVQNIRFRGKSIWMIGRKTPEY